MANKMNKVSSFLINVTKNIISSFFVDILFSFATKNKYSRALSHKQKS